MKLLFITQYRENYGAHDWDGKGECPQYWKNKGGSTYIVENVSIEQAMDPDFSDSIASMISYSSDYAEVIVIADELLDNGDDIPCEEWEAPYVCVDPSTLEFVAEDTSGYTSKPVTSVRRIKRPNAEGKLEACGTQYKIDEKWVSYQEGCDAAAAYRAAQETEMVA